MRLTPLRLPPQPPLYGLRHLHGGLSIVNCAVLAADVVGELGGPVGTVEAKKLCDGVRHVDLSPLAIALYLSALTAS